MDSPSYITAIISNMGLSLQVQGAPEPILFTDLAKAAEFGSQVPIDGFDMGLNKLAGGNILAYQLAVQRLQKAGIYLDEFPMMPLKNRNLELYSRKTKTTDEAASIAESITMTLHDAFAPHLEALFGKLEGDPDLLEVALAPPRRPDGCWRDMVEAYQHLYNSYLAWWMQVRCKHFSPASRDRTLESFLVRFEAIISLQADSTEKEREARQEKAKERAQKRAAESTAAETDSDSDSEADNGTRIGKAENHEPAAKEIVPEQPSQALKNLQRRLEDVKAARKVEKAKVELGKLVPWLYHSEKEYETRTYELGLNWTGREWMRTHLIGGWLLLIATVLSDREKLIEYWDHRRALNVDPENPEQADEFDNFFVSSFQFDISGYVTPATWSTWAVDYSGTNYCQFTAPGFLDLANHIVNGTDGREETVRTQWAGHQTKATSKRDADTKAEEEELEEKQVQFVDESSDSSDDDCDEY